MPVVVLSDPDVILSDPDVILSDPDVILSAAKDLRNNQRRTLDGRISNPPGSEPVRQILRYAQDDTAA